MKHKRQNVICTIAAALLVGCSGNDELTQEAYPADNIVRLTATVLDSQTRSSITESTLSEFGIFIENFEDVPLSYNNVKVTKLGDDWTPAQQMLWGGDDSEMRVFAYAPYNPSFAENFYDLADVTVSTDQTNDTKSDLLVFCGSGEVWALASNGRLYIPFKHALCKLSIKLSFKDEFYGSGLLTANPVSSVVVRGTKVNGNCYLEDGKVKADATASATPVTAWKESFTAQTNSSAAAAEYQCILIPQTIDANGFEIEIKATVGSTVKTFTWTSKNAVTLESGKSQQINLVVGKDQIYVGGITVNAWGSGDTVDGGVPCPMS